MAGACGAEVAPGSAGAAGWVCTGCSTLRVWVLSVSLHAATPNRATAENVARISFFIPKLLQKFDFPRDAPRKSSSHFEAVERLMAELTAGFVTNCFSW